MSFIEDFKSRLFKINKETFEESSLALFDFQYRNNAVYRSYCDSLRRSPATVSESSSIPCLPIQFFKEQIISSSQRKVQAIFKSSGTTSVNRSQHHITDLDFYHSICKKTFEDRLVELQKIKLIALLPSYQEVGDSSLINMIDSFMKYTDPKSGYFPHGEIGDILKEEGPKILFGVSYALLDASDVQTSNLTVIETGGMKGRKKEITRNELHSVLKQKFQVNEIWSEYGMTELMSQAYGKNGIFKFPEWVRVYVREINDPFSYRKDNQTGGINIIDLANIDSCAFIETKDIGIMQKSDEFEILGRYDNSDIRGCNLLI